MDLPRPPHVGGIRLDQRKGGERRGQAVPLGQVAGGEADFEPVQLTDDAMDRIAAAMGCDVQVMTFDPYPA